MKDMKAMLREGWKGRGRNSEGERRKEVAVRGRGGEDVVRE